MISEYDRAIAEARRTVENQSKSFCIGTSLLNPCAPFMSLWERIAHPFQDYTLHIVPYEDTQGNILSEVAALGIKFDFLIAVCDSKQWFELADFLPIGSYRFCAAVSKKHHLAKAKRLSIEDFYGQTLMLFQEGDSASVDAVRRELNKHDGIKIEDTSFYDIDVFNHCSQTQNILISVECWEKIHPSLVTIPIDWDLSTPCGILYSREAPDDVQEFVSYVKMHLREG